MKNFCLLLIFIPMLSFGQSVHSQYIESNIDEVKLYLTAGQMVHKQRVKLMKGRNKLKFSGISAYADPQSIQFKGVGSYRLVSVSTEMDFLAAEQFNPRISVLKDSLETLQDELQFTKDQMDAYQAEKGMMNTNRDLGGNAQNLSVEQIKEAATYFRQRTLEINQELSKLRKVERRYYSEIQDMRAQLVEMNYDENQRSNQVVVLLDLDAPGTMETELSYLVSDCGWSAMYDLSAADISGKINLKYKAQVYNNTGNDWSDIALTLSTADPQLSASHPRMSPWYLTENYAITGSIDGKKKYYAPVQRQQDYRQSAISNLNWANDRVYDNYFESGDINKGFDKSGYFDNSQSELSIKKNVNAQRVQMRSIDISELSTEFNIKNAFSCPSDMKPYIVDVKEVDLDATFSHITVPKLDRSAFLMANIIGWQDLDLIPGPTNVYFGGVYVGVSQINTRNVSDTLSLSFGRDDKVTVMRKLKKEFSTKRTMGNYKRDSYMYEVAIRNNHSTPIDIEVYDQVPISQSNQITVSTDEISDGTKNDETGEVKWRLKVAANGVVSKEIGYTVKYPKNMRIEVQRYRTVSSPSF
ncbi:MAG: DUF4139 domain-containing protein [Crocinitomicaceae bacterium]|nr:DUF4139 domain-containing protein [Crocinitomicaceae bacterium]